MVDITHKSNSLRIATATAVVRLSEKAALDALENNEVPKGNVFEISRAAGLFAVKRTSDMIPDCHPLPIESTTIKHQISGMEVTVEVEVKTIYKTGVEVEAMHAASVVALTIYDMLKPLDKGIEIGDIRLLKKSGGKGSFDAGKYSWVRTLVVVCSDTVAAGEKEDRSGLALLEKLKGFHVENSERIVVSDDPDQIKKAAVDAMDRGVDLIVFTGGTGVSPRDNTPEALLPLIEKRLPGVEETIRSYGQQRTPFSMASRTVAGIARQSVVLALPGSVKGATESMDAVFPHLLHLFHVLKGGGH
ncbi:MAG: bifunctional molybdenum cofactor biosynthesis protein MoaC/MoaB [Saprospirales bacterium]|nr:MAG: bifunctional molybdenum cofactor biosynthesis protein MoaC/MoaB [Saprospirales bacterium]